MKGWLKKMAQMGSGKSRVAILAENGGAAGENAARWREMYIRGGALELPAAISGELARLTTMEMKVSFNGKRGEFVEKTLGPLLEKLRREMEFGMAQGTLIFKPYFDGREIRVDTVRAESFVPAAWDGGGNITAAVFVQKLHRNGEHFTRLEYHRLENRRYKVDNIAFRSRTQGELGKEIPLTEVDEWKNMGQSIVMENIERPLFAVFRTPLADSSGLCSPMGVSVFAKAEKLIKDAEALYKNLLWEFESGKRRLYVDVTAFERDKNGNPKLPDTELFRVIDVNDGGFFSEWSPQFRNQALEEGLNAVLQRIEFNCSLAYGTLSQPSYVEKTAEEVKASKQRSYSFVCALQSQLKKALGELIYGIQVWGDIYALAPAGECRWAVEFDDSVAADRKAEYEEKLKLTQMGIMKPWEMRAWYFGENEETARRSVEA